MASKPGTFRPHTVATRKKARRHSDLYASPHWKRLSTFIRRRDPLCVLCPGDDPHPSVEADHIIALSDGGEPFDPDNLQGVCRRCHGRKSRQENVNRA